MKKIAQLINWYKKNFCGKKIVYSKTHQAGLFVKATQLEGIKYITIAITNRAVVGNANPAIIYHIKAKDVTGIRQTHSYAKQWIYNKLGIALQPNKVKPIAN